jgi:ABC-type cobalamin transport system permease subunit
MFSHPNAAVLHSYVISTFQSTVMLTANVGFLAIPGVVLSNLNGTDLTSASQVLIFPSSSQMASALSVEASIGSIVIGLLLVRHNRTKQKEDPAGAVSSPSPLIGIL